MNNTKGHRKKSIHRKCNKEELLTDLANCRKVIKGSLTRNRRRCGKPQCRCMSGELHESLAITYKQNRKSFLVHVPEHLQTLAKEAIEDYHKLKKLIEEISLLNLEAFKEQARKQKNLKKKQTISTGKS